MTKLAAILDWLQRNTAAVASGRAEFSSLDTVPAGSRFYPLLYLLTRVLGARDFGSGLPLHSHLLGHLSGLQIHHIFPKAVLYAAGYGRSQVNAVANFCFLTQETNLAIGKREPVDYFSEVKERQPDALASLMPEESVRRSLARLIMRRPS